jgi:hypothetical protein
MIGTSKEERPSNEPLRLALACASWEQERLANCRATSAPSYDTKRSIIYTYAHIFELKVKVQALGCRYR